FVQSRNHEHRNVTQCRTRFHSAKDGITVDIWHQDIQKDEIERAFGQHFKRAAAAFRLCGLMALALEALDENFAILLPVVDHEYPPRDLRSIIDRFVRNELQGIGDLLVFGRSRHVLGRRFGDSRETCLAERRLGKIKQLSGRALNLFDALGFSRAAVRKFFAKDLAVAQNVINAGAQIVTYSREWWFF